MQRRDLLIGTIVLIAIILIVLFIQARRQEATNPALSPTPIGTPTTAEQEQRFEDRFKLQVPDEGEKANLQDVSGRGFSGLATRVFKNGIYDITVLADLPDPETGKFYQVWLRNDTETRNLGTMRVAKGGFLLDATFRQDLTNLDRVIISLESKSDNTIESTYLQGSF